MSDKASPKTAKNNKSKDNLLEQKYIDLSTTFERMKLKPEITKTFAELIGKIDVLLKEEHSWDNASTIEQRLASLFDENELDIEIEVNLLEAQRRLAREQYDLFKKQYKTYTDHQGKLNVLCNIYKKLQNSYDLEEQKKQLLSHVRLSNSIAFLLSIMMFFMLDNVKVVAYFSHVEGKTEFIIASLAAGWMGACFSMLFRMKGDISKQSLPELTAMSRADNLISRSLIGMVSGLLIFYSFESGLLQGVMFPELVFECKSGDIELQNELWTRDRSHAMLVFWCFLSGFSEKLLPNLLAKAEKKMEGQSV